jgi:hypothetical protein
MEFPRLISAYRPCLILAFLLTSSTLQAQTVHDSGTWLAMFARGDVCHADDCRLKWWFDGHARFFDDAGGFGQSILRPGLGYALSDAATVWAGYGWIRTSPLANPEFDEHRTWQQITWSKDFDRARLGLRSRLEQRFLETGADTGWRFRQLVSLRCPLSCSRFSFVAWDEVFIHLNDTDWGATSGFDQNRLFLGLGFKCESSSPYRVEVGYLNQFVDRNATDDLSNHIVAINFFWSP